MNLGYFSEKEFRKQFEVCFKQYFRPLCFYAISLVKDTEVARDIVHDVFLVVWNRRASIDFLQPMYPYLLSLTRNNALNYLTHLKVISRHEELQFQEGEKYVSPDDEQHEELICNIIKRIDELPDRCGEVMRYALLSVRSIKKLQIYLVFP